MSIKIEYDLEEIPSEIEQDNHSTNIDIKLEFPYQSLQFPFRAEENDKQPCRDRDKLEEKDPLELDDVKKDYPISKPPPTPRKLKKITTAICTKCNLGFPSPFLFEQHMIQSHQDERPYPCKHCKKPFATPAHQKKHEAIHDPKRYQGEPNFSCDICSKSYHLKRSLLIHKLRIHAGYKPPKKLRSAPITEHHSTSGVKNPNAYRKPKEVHSCPHCDLTFDMKSLLQNHIIVHTKERPFSCPICQESFPRKAALTNHIKNIHQSTNTLKGRPQTRPKWQAKQDYPCTICGKVYPIPCKLSGHMRLHTGEKPFPCKSCDSKFRTIGELNSHTKQVHLKEQLRNNPLKLFKCRVCGKNDFVMFSSLENHRLQVHRNIRYESEQEKPFACRICGKPYFLREGALICGILGHDSSKLRNKMFKVRCPECPDGEIFGFHSVLALRKHWGREHGDKIIPARFRQGMNGDKELKDEMPKCTVDKVKKEDIRVNGVDIEQVKREGLMYIELDLLEVPEEERFFKRVKQRGKEKIEYICTICGVKLSSKRVLRHHIKVKHDLNRKELTTRKNFEYECKICDKKFGREGMLKKHSRMVHAFKVGGTRRKVGRSKKKILEGMKKTEIKIEGGIIEENDIGIGLTSVNIKDQGDVQAILNFQNVKVQLTRVKFSIIK